MWEPSRTSSMLVTAMHRANYLLVAIIVAAAVVQLTAKRHDLRVSVPFNSAFRMLSDAVTEEGLKVQWTDASTGTIRTEHAGDWHPIRHRLSFVVSPDGADSSRVRTMYETGAGDQFVTLQEQDLSAWERGTIENVLARVRDKAPSSAFSAYGIERVAMTIAGLLSCISLGLYWMYFLLNPVAEVRMWLREFVWSALGLTVVTAIVLIVYFSIGPGEYF